MRVVLKNIQLLQTARLTAAAKFAPQKAKKTSIFNIIYAFFPNIWPLAGPNIEKGGVVTSTGDGRSTDTFWDF